MKKVFENVEQKVLNDYLIGKVNSKKDNCLFRLLLNCYSYHQPLYLSPDDVINNMVLLYSKYVIINAEKFRTIFVDHDGKKELTVNSDGGYSDSRIEEFTKLMLVEIQKEQLTDRVSWAKIDLSTTKQSDRLLRELAILASQKEYYSFGWEFCCGFPEVNLLGTIEDWQKVLSLIDNIPELDQFMVNWKKDLKFVVTNMLDLQEDFWQRCATITKYGSGGQIKVDGWMKVFNPFRSDGTILPIVKDNEILNLVSQFDINVNDNGNKFVVEVESGSVLKIDNHIQIENYVSLHKK